jgi:hypothetical protein
MKLPLGRRIFLGTTLVVVAVLGSALLATKRRADAAADDASARALGATASSIQEALASRSLTLLRLTQALVQVPASAPVIAQISSTKPTRSEARPAPTGSSSPTVPACCRHGRRSGASSAKTSLAAR